MQEVKEMELQLLAISLRTRTIMLSRQQQWRERDRCLQSHLQKWLQNTSNRRSNNKERTLTKP